MNKRALALLCVPLLMAAAPKPRHAAPSTHCALAKYFNAHETECNRPKKKPHAGAVAAQASKQAAARKAAARKPAAADAKAPTLAAAQNRAAATEAGARMPAADAPHRLALAAHRKARKPAARDAAAEAKAGLPASGAAHTPALAADKKAGTSAAIAARNGRAAADAKARTQADAAAHTPMRAADAKARAPQPVPAPAPAPPPAGDNTDISHAIPAKEAVKLPSTRAQFDTLRNEIVHDRPAMLDAKQKSDALKAQALALQQKLVATAARVQALEEEKIGLDADIVRLAALDRTLSAGFARDRVAVARLLALLERMQHDMPPPIVLKPDDALGAARSAMLIGASVPGVYAQAASLARRIKQLEATRAALVARRAEGVRNALALRGARGQLDQLLAMKQLEADAAASRYGDLATRLTKAATTAADLQALLEKVSALRHAPAQKEIVAVSASPSGGGLQPRSLLLPVVGKAVPGGMDGVGGARAPGLTFAVSPGARVIAPADSQVIFAGPYHKTGQVLILELTAGYDLVLAGLGRVDVRPNDEVLAGEPVGTMPNSGQDARLYFELRQNGHGTSPAPWLAVELRKAQRS